MKAFMRFNKGVFRMPVHWRLWMMLLVFFNLVAPLVFITRLEAQVVLGVFMASGVLMTILTAVSGFTRLLGLGHVLWLGMVPFLWMRLSATPADDLFGLWMRGVIAINAISLVIDTTDVVRYGMGERAETVEGL